MNDNFAENLAKLCQKADQPARVTDGAMHDKAIRRDLARQRVEHRQRTIGSAERQAVRLAADRL